PLTASQLTDLSVTSPRHNHESPKVSGSSTHVDNDKHATLSSIGLDCCRRGDGCRLRYEPTIDAVLFVLSYLHALHEKLNELLVLLQQLKDRLRVSDCEHLGIAQSFSQRTSDCKCLCKECQQLLFAATSIIRAPRRPANRSLGRFLTPCV